jgi:hypothetical protein
MCEPAIRVADWPTRRTVRTLAHARLVQVDLDVTAGVEQRSQAGARTQQQSMQPVLPRVRVLHGRQREISSSERPELLDG